MFPTALPSHRPPGSCRATLPSKVRSGKPGTLNDSGKTCKLREPHGPQHILPSDALCWQTPAVATSIQHNVHDLVFVSSLRLLFFATPHPPMNPAFVGLCGNFRLCCPSPPQPRIPSKRKARMNRMDTSNPQRQPFWTFPESTTSYVPVIAHLDLYTLG